MKTTSLCSRHSIFVFAVAVLPALTGSAQISSVRLNEIQASPVHWSSEMDLVAGWIELHNPTPDDIDLAGTSVTDTTLEPRKFVFPPGSVIPHLGFLVVTCAQAQPGPLNAGFRLRSNGGLVYFFDRPGSSNLTVDFIAYGLQTADHSVGRAPDGNGAWTLTTPSPNSSNTAAPLGSPAGLRINEWMSASLFGPDWFELYNSSNLPVALGGLYLSDDPSRLTKHRLASLSFIGTGACGAYAIFFADGIPAYGVNHVNFRLSADGEAICVADASGSLIDAVLYTAQPIDISEGRLPDGSTNIILFTPQIGRWTATPGAPNPFPSILVLQGPPFLLQFHVPSNLTCTVEFQDNGFGPWLALTNIPAATADRSLEITDPTPAATQRLYRLRKD